MSIYIFSLLLSFAVLASAKAGEVESYSQCQQKWGQSLAGWNSFAASFGDGRLGNQMSTFATLWALKENYSLKPKLTIDQEKLLNYYFVKPRGYQVLPKRKDGQPWISGVYK